RRLGDIDESIVLLTEAQQFAEIIHDYFQLALIFNNLGLINLRRGEYLIAERYLLRGEQLSSDLENKYVQSLCYQNLGELFLLKGDIKHAVEMNQKSLKIKEELQNFTGQAYIFANLGRIHRRLGDFESSKKYFKDSIALINKYARTHINLPTLLSHYARTLIQLGSQENLDEANELIVKAKSVTAVIGQTSHPFTLNTEGLYHKTISDIHKAEKLFLRANKKANQIKSYFDSVESLMFLTEIALELYKDTTKRDHFKNAQAYLDEAMKLVKMKGQILKGQIISILMLNALFDASELNFGQALKNLEQARTEAITTGLIAEIEDINRLRDRITSQLPRTTTTDVDSVLSLISKFTDRSEKIKMKKEDIVLVTFKFAKRGPVPFYTSKKFLHTDPLYLAVINIGVVMSIQGQYFEGLFGPIPAAKMEDTLILYQSCLIKDKKSQDERLKGKNYILLTLLYPKLAEDKLLYNRHLIQEMFEHYIIINSELSNWTEKTLDELYNNILKSFDVKFY
ncbi:MAG: tetratricopeptide repeat protein, partial [Candidatus Hodarchaeales archaeon]